MLGRFPDFTDALSFPNRKRECVVVHSASTKARKVQLRKPVTGREPDSVPQ